MKEVATISTPLFTIADIVISIFDGLYSLNDLHKASGKQAKHKPSNFMANLETQELITEIEREKQIAVKVVKGGNLAKVKQGTYVCKELVYRYAMWISPKFALLVIRTFDALVSRTDSKQRECLITACDKLAVGNTLRSDVYTQVANHFGYERVTQIPTPLLPEAVAFVYDMILARQKAPQNPNYNPEYGEKRRLVGQATNLAVMKMTEDLVNELGSIKERLLKVRGLAGVSHESFMECKHGMNLSWERQLEVRRQAQDLIDDYVEKGKVTVTFHQ